MIALKKLIISLILVFLTIMPATVYAYNDYLTLSVEQLIVESLENFEDEIDISDYNIPKDDMSEIITSIIEENPQLFYVEREYQISYSEQTNECQDLYFSFKYSDSELKVRVNDFNSRIQLIVDEIMKSETDFDKIHSCHDYIVQNYGYDQTKGSADVYNMLLTGEGTCMAYTGLFDYIMTQCGIESTTAKSEQLNHIWNVVELDGEYYNVDVTWDDPIGGLPFSTSHKYLLKSDDYFVSHKHEGRESSVECTSTLYDSYTWADESILTKMEDVEGLVNYVIAYIPILITIFLVSVLIILVMIIIITSRKRSTIHKKNNNYPPYY